MPLFNPVQAPVASPALAPGAIGAWYADQTTRSSRASVPNALSATTSRPNLVTGSRRRFSQSAPPPTLWTGGGVTVTDNAAFAPDGTLSASLFTGTGGWYFKPSAVIPVAAGTYTMGFSVRWLGTGDAGFRFGDVGGGTVQAFTAPDTQWHRYVVTTTYASAGNSNPFFECNASGSSNGNFAIDDLEMFPGTADLGPIGADGTLWLCNSDFQPAATLTAGKFLDFSAGNCGLIQLPPTSFAGGVTVMVLANRAVVPASGFDVFLYTGQTGGAPNFSAGTTFGPLSGPGIAQGANYASLGLAQQNGNLFDYPGDGIAVQTHTYDDATAESWINDVRLLSGAASVPPANISDVFLGFINQPSLRCGYQIGGLVIWPRVLSAAEIASSSSALLNRAVANGNTLPPAQRTVLFLGDSITYGQAGLSYAYRFAATASPRVRGANYGISGATVATMQALNPTILPIIAQAASGGRKVICHVGLGSNDIGGQSSATAFLTSLFAYADQLRAAGAKVVLATILPRNNGDPVYESVRLAANAGMRAAVGVHCDGISDFASDATMGVAGAEQNTTYYAGDHIHPNDAGYALLTPYVTASINSL